MFPALWLLLLALDSGLSALAPPQAEFVHVDFVVVNRVRSYDVEHDAWDRPRFVPRETVWISFWDRFPVAVLPVHGVIVARGWWDAHRLRSLSPCTEGWLFESIDRLNVVAADVRWIDSDFDWEQRNRRICRPLRGEAPR